MPTIEQWNYACSLNEINIRSWIYAPSSFVTYRKQPQAIRYIRYVFRYRIIFDALATRLDFNIFM